MINRAFNCGHTIGEYAFIGAGAVLTKDVPEHALMAGNPAKQVGWMCVCGEKLDAVVLEDSAPPPSHAQNV